MSHRLASVLRRNVSTMAMQPSKPVAPFVVVLGSTGTGKSELAVELATRFNGEVINSDAMQLYNGLPIITNKISPAEQRGIPHHLLGNITLDRNPWDVDDFKHQAFKLIDEIRGRGRLPILVGGTHYYIHALLFKDVFLDDGAPANTEGFPILEGSAEEMLKELQRVDPIMAERWHPKDRRKIQRSLAIYLHTGRPASEHYAEQRARKAQAAQQAADDSPWENLLFWVYTERETLKERLDARVDKMLDAGLLDEVRNLYEFKLSEAAAGRIVDMTKGIWQSIGYRQFEPYLLALDQDETSEKLEALKAKGVAEMQAATRRYAISQTRWVRLKQIPELRDQGADALENLYVLDSSDVSQFQSSVVEPAVSITDKFLKGEARPAAQEVSDMARKVLTEATQDSPSEKTFSKKTCDICNTTVTTEELWRMHLKGGNHRRATKRKKKLALVPVPADTESGEAQAEEPNERQSSPEIGSMFSI